MDSSSCEVEFGTKKGPGWNPNLFKLALRDAANIREHDRNSRDVPYASKICPITDFRKQIDTHFCACDVCLIFRTIL